MHRSRYRRRRGRRPTAARASRLADVSFSPESAGSGGPPTPSSSLRYCGQDAASRRRLCHMPTTLRYIFLQNLPCSTAPAPLRVDLFILPSAVPKPPRLLLLLDVKLVHTVDSKSWLKQGRKWESCSMNLGLGSKRKRGKVVDTGYPTGLLVEKTKKAWWMAKGGGKWTYFLVEKGKKVTGVGGQRK